MSKGKYEVKDAAKDTKTSESDAQKAWDQARSDADAQSSSGDKKS